MSQAGDWAGEHGICLLLPGQSRQQHQGSNRGDSGQATRDRCNHGGKAGNPQNLLTGVLWDLRGSGAQGVSLALNPDTQDSETKVPLPPTLPSTFVCLCGCCRGKPKSLWVNPIELGGTSQRATTCFLHELPELGQALGWAGQLPRCSLSSLGPPSCYQGPKLAGHRLRQTHDGEILQDSLNCFLL